MPKRVEVELTCAKVHAVCMNMLHAKRIWGYAPQENSEIVNDGYFDTQNSSAV